MRDELHAAIDALLEQLRPTVEPVPYYTQNDSPLGKRAHLDAIRTGKLKGWKVGRNVFARREDVHRFIEQHPVEPKRPAPELGSGDSVSEFLSERGIH